MNREQALAIVFAGPGKVELRQIHVPELRPDEILVRTEMTGISPGTDRSFLQGHYRGAMERFPLVYGYQRVGIVEAVGATVPQEQIAVGDRVFSGLAPCRLDPADGLGETGGAYTSLAVTHYSDVSPIHRGLPSGHPAGVAGSASIGLDEVALGGMAAIGLHAVELSQVRAGELVVVIGQGMIGQFDGQLSRLRGARVVVSDLIDRRLELAAAWGADRVVNPRDENLESVVKEERGKLSSPLGYGPVGGTRSAFELNRWSQMDGGADLVIDTTAQRQMVDNWPNLLRREGRLALQGYFPDPVPFDYHLFHFKRVQILCPGGFDVAGYGRVLDLMQLGLLQVKPLITHCLPVRSAPEAFRLVLEEPEQILGMVLDWRNV